MSSPDDSDERSEAERARKWKRIKNPDWSALKPKADGAGLLILKRTQDRTDKDKAEFTFYFYLYEGAESLRWDYTGSVDHGDEPWIVFDLDKGFAMGGGDFDYSDPGTLGGPIVVHGKP